MRLPGTGEGVARLVEVSMVNVDMSRLSNDRPITPPVGPLSSRNKWNFPVVTCVETTGALAVCRRVATGVHSMVDRHWLGDVSLAILVALPLAALAQPRASLHKPDAPTAAAKLSVASAGPTNGRISLLG
jgi:hypothetical protein